METKHTIAKRDPADVMRLARMGSFHQSRLSFMRVLLRRLKRENWKFSRPIWRINDMGVGYATYQARGPKRTYTLVAFAHDLPDELRSDRVIAEAWDATFTLFDGVPDEDDIKRLSQNVPLQEAGRIEETELTLSRANRSVRLFRHVIDCLSKGDQPDIDQLRSVGYLMRTTAVYGSGKFGAADRSKWADREEFSGSFQPELLSVWLIRAFTLDIVEHLARAKSPDAARIDNNLRHLLGVGNSTGLGMAPFLVNHPKLLHAWINARETALAEVRSTPAIAENDLSQFIMLVKRSQENVRFWNSEHPIQIEKNKALSADLAALLEHLNSGGLHKDYPWESLYLWAEQNLCIDAQELVVSLLLEPHGDRIDDLANHMNADEGIDFSIDGNERLGALKESIRQNYGWLKGVDFNDRASLARVWYTSIEKLEPRLGERFEEALDAYEQPLAPARDIAALCDDLKNLDDEQTIGEFLQSHPQHRHVVRRVQLIEKYPYGEIRDNTIDANMLPIDMLRCKLSFFGAGKFDPRSDRWVRINMFQGSPFPDELEKCDPDDMAYPALASA